MTINDTLNGLLNRADATVRSFIIHSLGKLIEVITVLNENELDSEIELALDHVKKAKGNSRLAKQLVAASLALYACGYRTVEFVAAQLTKKATAKILDRALQFMTVYKLINRLYGAGVHVKLADVRAFFRRQFEGEIKASAAKRAIFENMVGITVLDATYTYFVEGEKNEDGAWVIKPQLVKYEQSARLDAQKGTDFALKAMFTADSVKAKNEEFENAPVVFANAA